MYTYKAVVLYLNESKRKTPIYSDYRPGFVFNSNSNSQRSGALEFIKEERLHKGEMAIVNIRFISNDFIITSSEGMEFRFFEGPEIIGRGIIIDSGYPTTASDS